ncbi:MAG TPA: DoxX family protein [Nakamurella sp.]|nr:DoxX family protein [Nakamurella sp.]
MNVALWILQAVLAALFAASGVQKLTRPREVLVAKYAWMQDTPPATVRVVAVAEMAAAVGLIAPAAIGTAPILTPTAAAGLVLMLALAAGLHVRRREPSGVAVTVVLLVVSAVVAWGRFGPYGW